MIKKTEARVTHFIYFSEVPLQVGLSILSLPKSQRLVNGREVSVCSGAALFETLKNTDISCWKCGCKADRWIVMRGVAENPFAKPVLNLFAIRQGELVMLTRDHIIPKSVGGMDDPKNLRPACIICNNERGNELEGYELEFARANPQLIHPVRQQIGLEALAKNLAQLRPDQEDEKARLRQPFVALNII